MYNNKVLLKVKLDKSNNWFSFIWSNYRLQLTWDNRKWPVFLEQAANACDLPNFMRDFSKILKYMEQNHKKKYEAIFTLYELNETINWKISE